jgi:predicted nucleic-acid-binding Zn-ribbon protein
MATLDFFNDTKCPKCGLPALFRLGDKHYVTLQLISCEDQTLTNQQFYCKICKNCGYAETYAKFLIDRFYDLDNRGGFGEVTSAPSGMILVTIYIDYDYDGKKAHDFTIPFHPRDWVDLQIGLDSLSDSNLIAKVLYGPYYQAWQDRVRRFPDEFAINLRQLLRGANIQGNA